MANPYVTNHPADPIREFAGREEELRRIRECVQSTVSDDITNVFIKGEWGIGKSSLIEKVGLELKEKGPVLSETVHHADPNLERGFYRTIIKELLAYELPDVSAAGIPQAAAQALEQCDLRALQEVLLDLWKELHEKYGYELVLVTLDNIERADPVFLSHVRDVFQWLKKQRARYMLLCAGTLLPITDSSPSPPSTEATSRFVIPVPLGPFSVTESLAAIRKPLEYRPGQNLPGFSFADDAARMIHERAAGHPWFLKLICREVYDIMGGTGTVDVPRLQECWPEVAKRLATARFAEGFDRLSDLEQETLLRASFLTQPFRPLELRRIPSLRRSLDVFLSRLREAGMLRQVSPGRYEIDHPLLQAFLLAKAREKGLKPTTVIPIPERQPATGRVIVQEALQECATRRLDILDQHFRGRAVSFLERVKPQVRIRILMGEDPQWSKTVTLLGELEEDLRKRIEVRAWPEAADQGRGARQRVPFHYRAIIGDRRAWRFDHSLEQAGRKKAFLSDASAESEELRSDFEGWWKEGRRIFPPPTESPPLRP